MPNKLDFTFPGTREELFIMLKTIRERELASVFDEEFHRGRTVLLDGRHFYIEGKPEAERGIDGGIARIIYRATSEPSEYESDPEPYYGNDMPNPVHSADYPRPETGIILHLTPYFVGSNEVTRGQVEIGHPAFEVRFNELKKYTDIFGPPMEDDIAPDAEKASESNVMIGPAFGDSDLIEQALSIISPTTLSELKWEESLMVEIVAVRIIQNAHAIDVGKRLAEFLEATEGQWLAAYSSKKETVPSQDPAHFEHTLVRSPRWVLGIRGQQAFQGKAYVNLTIERKGLIVDPELWDWVNQVIEWLDLSYPDSVSKLQNIPAEATRASKWETFARENSVALFKGWLIQWLKAADRRWAGEESTLSWQNIEQTETYLVYRIMLGNHHAGWVIARQQRTNVLHVEVRAVAEYSQWWTIVEPEITEWARADQTGPDPQDEKGEVRGDVVPGEDEAKSRQEQAHGGVVAGMNRIGVGKRSKRRPGPSPQERYVEGAKRYQAGEGLSDLINEYLKVYIDKQKTELSRGDKDAERERIRSGIKNNHRKMYSEPTN